MNPETLVIGTGKSSRPDVITVDINPDLGPDIVHDLQIVPWPFAENSFKQVICHHVLEHLRELTPVMAELHRICRPDGRILIEVPHFSSRNANTPHHVLRFSHHSLDAYIGGFHWVGTARRFRMVDRKITFHRAFRRYQLHRIFNHFPVSYERFWTYICPAENISFELQPVK